MVKRDFTRLTPDEKINGIKATKLPDYIRSKYHGNDMREAIAQSTEMAIQLGINMGLSPEDALSWARKLQDVDTRLVQNTIKLNNRATYEYVDMVISNIVSGAPKGTFLTLLDLQNTHPNGAEGVFLVLDNDSDASHVYFWNGKDWEDAGIYQSSGLASVMTVQNQPWEVV